MKEATGEMLRAYLDREYEGEILLANGFDSALIGVVSGWFAGGSHTQVALYDYALCVQVLVADGMSEEDADEYLSYNVCGAYVGSGTPAFATVHRTPAILPITG